MKALFYPADIFVVKGTSPFLSDAIAEMTKEEGQPGVSHAFVSVGEGENPEIIEAVFPRVRKVKLSEALKTAEYALCLRPIGMTGFQRAHVVMEALKHEGELYGLDRYLALFPGALLKSDFLQELNLTPKFPVCSELCGLCLQAAGWSFGEDPAGLLPSEMLAWARRETDRWRIFSVDCPLSG